MILPALLAEISRKLDPLGFKYAFADRGAGDYYGSADLEDIIAVIDGRAAIVTEIASAEPALRAFVITTLDALAQNPSFQESLPGHLPFDSASQRRLPGLREKLRLIAFA